MKIFGYFGFVVLGGKRKTSRFYPNTVDGLSTSPPPSICSCIRLVKPPDCQYIIRMGKIGLELFKIDPVVF